MAGYLTELAFLMFEDVKKTNGVESYVCDGARQSTYLRLEFSKTHKGLSYSSYPARAGAGAGKIEHNDDGACHFQKRNAQLDLQLSIHS